MERLIRNSEPRDGEQPVVISIEKAAVSLVGKEGWEKLRQEAEMRVNPNGGTGKWSHVAGLSMRIYARRELLTVVETLLHQLSEKFPGERTRVDSDKDPAFIKAQNKLLGLKRPLALQQRVERLEIKEILRGENRRVSRTTLSCLS